MEIRLLGLVEASHDGHAVHLGGAKPRALFAILALQANAPVSADRLIQGLWGEAPPATAPKLVQVLVSQLRKQLAGADAEIVTRGRGYELRVHPDAIDALRFERLLTSDETGSHAGEALALWRGPPLDDLADEPFAAAEIRRLEDLWLGAREASIDAALAGGREAAVLGELDELVREHPLRERLHGQRMLALYRCGRQADALEAFRHARRFLLDEVGLEPGTELRRLNDAILRQDPDLGAPPPRRFPARARRRPWLLLVAAAAAVAAVVALAVTQVGGTGGLDGIAEDSTGVMDPGSGRIVAQYAVGHAPNALVAGAGSVWIANGRDGTVSRIDRGRGQVTTIDVGGEPTALAFGYGSLWVADGQNRRVEQVDSRTNRVVRRQPAGNAPRGVAVAGGAVWLASAVDGQVGRLDLAHGGRMRRIDIPGGPAAIAAGAGAVWVGGEEDGLVTKLDPHSGAALKAIGVGNGPTAIAVGYGGVWVANRDDGTVTRIDAATDAVSDLVRVGGGPVAVAAGLGAIWVADGEGAVVRIDPRTRGVSRRIALGSAPTALAIAGGSLWATTTASRASHRGGTLHFASAPFDACNCLDPAGYDASTLPVLSLAYDGLLAYRRVPGVGGGTLVADLAASVPQPTNGGRTYTFPLRAGLRFSDGTPVRPEDFRASIERAMRLAGQVAPIYDGIAGARACRPGAATSHGASRPIPRRARSPSTSGTPTSSFCTSSPARWPTCSRRAPPRSSSERCPRRERAPTRSPRTRRDAACGSCATRASAPGRPRRAPTASPARSTSRPPRTWPGRWRPCERGRADAVVASDRPQLAVDQGRALALTDASRVSSAPEPGISYLFVNLRERPFDDPRVRRALNYAIDRRRVVQLAGGHGLAGLSCQLPRPGCPATRPRVPSPARRRRPAAGRRRTWPSPIG